ncbi:MAG: 4-hydroxybutyrate CoA-transferase, partial [Leptonema sp. (in: bacteria)]
MKKWEEYYKSRIIRPDEAVSFVKSNMRIFLTGNAAMPWTMIKALTKIAPNLENVELNHLLTFGDDPFRQYEGIRSNAWFVGPSIRKSVNECKSDYIPIFLSEIAKLVRSGSWPIDVAIIHVSPPDRYGYMSYGVETSITKPCAEMAKLVIAQVNRKMPRALGDSFIHVT